MTKIDQRHNARHFPSLDSKKTDPVSDDLPSNFLRFFPIDPRHTALAGSLFFRTPAQMLGSTRRASPAPAPDLPALTPPASLALLRKLRKLCMPLLLSGPDLPALFLPAHGATSLPIRLMLSPAHPLQRVEALFVAGGN